MYLVIISLVYHILIQLIKFFNNDAFIYSVDFLHAGGKFLPFFLK